MKCYAAFLRQQLRSLTLYRFEFFIKSLYGLIAMYGARCLWVALHNQNPALLERSLPAMITYAMLAMISFAMFSIPTALSLYYCISSIVNIVKTLVIDRMTHKEAE